jgi:hypothetical protein
MTEFTRHDLPADITVFAGEFDSQPLVFAHLLDEAPDLLLEHVEVIRDADPTRRLAVYFDPRTIAAIKTAAHPYTTLLLILPAAFDTLICPLVGSEHLIPLGVHRGTVPRMVARVERP